MTTRIFIILALLMAVIMPPAAKAADRDEDIKRIDKSARVFKEIVDTPDKGIPHDLLHCAKCITIIPGDVKFAFIFGGSYGRGVATCRRQEGWSAARKTESPVTGRVPFADDICSPASARALAPILRFGKQH
ncbi:MAG: hypothetical protein WB630_17575 [Candidatus Acidiferrales bacterium]